MKLWPLGFILIGGLLLCTWLSACSKTSPSSEIRMALSQGPLNLDPRYASDAASARINRLIYKSLIDFDAQTKPCPDLAAWQVLDDRHYRFTLVSPRATFHNGVALTAKDVAATYQSLLSLKNSPHTAEFANISDIRVVDENTVDFYLTVPDTDFPARLIIGILPAELIQQAHDFAHDPVGNGPLKFASWRGTLKLSRISDGQAFNLQEVKDPTVRVLKLLRGEVDLLQGDLPPELVKYLAKQSDIKVQASIGSNFSYLGFNLQDPVLGKLEVRQAIAHAIDRPTIIREAMVDESRPAGAVLPPEHWAGNPNLPTYEYNPQLARELLQKAGVTLPLRLVYKTSTDAQRVRLATIMQAQMQAAGIALEIRSLDWGTFFDDIKHGQFQLFGLTWVGIKTPDIYRMAFHSQSVPPKGANRGQLKDTKLDQLLEAEHWSAVTQYVHEQLPYVPLWYEGQFVAMRKNLVDYALKPDGNWDGLKTIKKNNVNF
ncbi:peptide ABC transporter substrate-binding protein [Methylovorus sp. MM2]|uniref:ABC transporter substrate-binding protein n=1 Tax=Methylovorus sp. MM2 TaxID=1848038 RepID=UPI0007E0B190|nr:ABC transporter substrate-binding protein [Methylovorus sp. MM2]OAM52650.1 peptide ABC transporter substrate-binding protein [Methylovorus sp. MM2]